MRRVIVFLKYPDPGLVKSRLAATVGPQRAARLARHFAEQTLAAVDALGMEAEICFHPPERQAALRAWLGPARFSFPQRGADLGERMHNAFADAFARGAMRVVLTGTDAPDRPGEFLAAAFERLDEYDTVLGPALDGGYHLIAMRRDSFAPEIFAGIEWSTRRVLAQTLDALRAVGRTASLLPPWRDIDDKAGLDGYLKGNPEAALFLRDEGRQGDAPDRGE